MNKSKNKKNFQNHLNVKKVTSFENAFSTKNWSLEIRTYKSKPLNLLLPQDQRCYPISTFRRRIYCTKAKGTQLLKLLFNKFVLGDQS